MAQVKTLNGFRDFLPEDCAVRNYIFSVWRQVAQKFGFQEYEAPILELTELYLKKSGGEISGQLFRFEDQGGRDVSMRPEVTPSLARIVASKHREFPKPMKWFQMGQCFRYERPQKGRLREFYQYNVDLIGESSIEADIELIALSIEVMKAFGFKAGDFIVRLSHRSAWKDFCISNGISEEEDITRFLSIIDKWEKLTPEKLTPLLEPFNLPIEAVQEFFKTAEFESQELQTILTGLQNRGLADFVKVDMQIVRGLAYYTGTVFEVFDLKHSMRAVAGGGRYDDLAQTMSDGAADVPVIGFGMGDVVLKNLILATPEAKALMDTEMSAQNSLDVYLVIADEEQRSNAVKIATELRNADITTDFLLSPLKIGKQFQRAEQVGAKIVIVLGDEFPKIKVKILKSKKEHVLESSETFVDAINKMLNIL